MGNFFQELRRRNVVRVVGAYLVVGWVLMQIATGLEESLQLPEWFDGVVVGFLMVGLPVAIILSWVFDLTPEGIVRTGTDTGEPKKAAGRKLDYVIVAGIVVVGAVFAWRSLGTPEIVVEESTALDTATQISAASIAVLPFADLSPAGDQEYFSDGISEEILNLLAGVEALQVTSRTSAFQFKGRGLGIPEIAANLKVRHVVEGSVRKAGDTLRITAQLIDAEGDRHLWSDTFDRPLTAENVFAIQDEISQAIVAALGTTLGFDASTKDSILPSTNSLTAYELFLQARPIVQSRVDLATANELLLTAVEQDSEFAKAWELLAAVQFLMWDYGETDMSLEEANRRTVEYANKALAIEANSSLAIAAKVHIQTKDVRNIDASVDWNYELSELSRALEIDPRNDSALNWRGLTRQLLGDLEGALADYTSCADYEPFNVPCAENRVYALASLGRDEESFRHYLKLLDLGMAKLEYVSLPMLARLGKEGHFKSATNSRRFLFGWHEHDKLYEALQNPGGDYQQLINSIRQFQDDHPERDKSVFFDVRGYLGDYSVGLDGFSYWGESKRNYRQSNEFKDRIQNMGILQYWQQQGFPPQCRPVGEEGFACD